MSTSATVLRRYPGSSRLLMHPGAGRRARSIRTLAGSSDWRRDLAERAGGLAVALTGPRVWTTPASTWPWPSITPDELVGALRPTLPGLRLIGAVVPRQPGRARLSLLCRYAGTAIVVKLGVEEPLASLRTESIVLSMLTKNPLPGIATPEVITFEHLCVAGVDVAFLATSAVGIGTQRPAIDVALRTFEADLAERLATLEAPEASDDLIPTHGDLTPWNLRRTARGLALFDWEAAGWREPGSDIADYRRASDQVRRRWRPPARRTP